MVPDLARAIDLGQPHQVLPALAEGSAEKGKDKARVATHQPPGNRQGLTHYTVTEATDHWSLTLLSSCFETTEGKAEKTTAGRTPCHNDTEVAQPKAGF